MGAKIGDLELVKGREEEEKGPIHFDNELRRDDLATKCPFSVAENRNNCSKGRRKTERGQMR